jgi:hypothetical protein
MLKLKKWLPLFVFVIFFAGIPVKQFVPDAELLFKMIPGDLGDSRLNNYFLENIYQFLNGKSESLWHLGFFWPFPYVLGFSDNLFGSFFIYAIPRWITGKADTAFQVWYLFGYAANYFSAYYALRKIGISRLSASVGSAIFAFAIPVTAHMHHGQLHYRFGAPLSLLFFFQFLESQRIRSLTISGAFLVWQFYCGVYIGFFTLLLMLAVVTVFLFQQRENFRGFLNEFIIHVKVDWRESSAGMKAGTVAAWLLLIGLLLLLFYPYMQVSKIYGIKRSWAEIAVMLPRPQSYFIADTSWFWQQPNSPLSWFWSQPNSPLAVPMRHEHQMFPGLISMVLLLSAVVYGVRTRDSAGKYFTLMVGALALLVIVTLNLGGLSLWFFVYWLPLASAIRAMTRIDLIMLLPLAVSVAYFLDRIREKAKWGTRLILFIILPLLFIEFSATLLYSSLKTVWRERLDAKVSLVKNELPNDAVLFFSSPVIDGQHTPELDAMWASFDLKRKTMNGYSGSTPPYGGYGSIYGTDCAVLPKRVLSYLEFSRKRGGEEKSYRDIMSKVVPIGFENCDPAWWISPPSTTLIDRVYSMDEFSKLSFGGGEIKDQTTYKILKFNLQNKGGASIAAGSSIGKPIRVSWRLLNKKCEPDSNWNERVDLPLDIPAGGAVEMRIPLKSEIIRDSCGVEVSLVQEHVFWGHDIGIKPLLVKF